MAEFDQLYTPPTAQPNVAGFKDWDDADERRAREAAIADDDDEAWSDGEASADGGETAALDGFGETRRSAAAENDLNRSTQSLRHVFDGVPVTAPPPRTMRFGSWLMAEGERHELHITFDTHSSTFGVTIDEDKHPFTFIAMGKNGEPVNVWDLHVGAIIDVLGRPTTLKSAGSRTVAWLDAQARKLHRVVNGLEARLNKFRSVSVRGFNPMERQPAFGSLGGRVHLRPIVTLYSSLRQMLHEFE